MRRIHLGPAILAASAAMISLPAFGQQQGAEKAAAPIPTGAVMAFDLPACPNGWSSFAPATARVIVGSGQNFDPGYDIGDDGQKLTPKNYRYAAGGESHALTAAELPSGNPNIVVQKTGNPPGPPTTVTNLMVTTVNPCLDSGCSQIGGFTWGAHPGDQHVEFNAHIDTGGAGQPMRATAPYLALTYCRKN